MGRLEKFKVAFVPPPVRSARSVLADAIADRNGKQRRAEAARASVDGAQRLLAAAKQKHVDASQALQVARERASDVLATNVAAGTAPQGGAGLQAARHAELEASDEVEVVSGALARVELAAEQPGYEFDMAQRRVEECADAVLALEAPRFVEAEIEAHKQRARAQLVLSRVARALPQQNFDPEYQAIRMAAGHVITWPGADWYEGLEAERQVINALWDAARAALLSDPTAALPE